MTATNRTGGNYRCALVPGTLNQGSTNGFRISDLAEYADWHAWLDGSDVSGIKTDWGVGVNVWGVELGDNQDDCAAKATNINEWHSGDQWSYLDGLDLYYDLRASYCHFHRINVHAGEYIAP